MESEELYMKMYVYLVENKANGNKYVMIGNLKNCNVGSGRYLYQLVNEDYEYARKTPYGVRNNISTGIKYNSKQYRVVHQMVA